MEEKLLGQIGFLVTEFSSAIVSTASSSPSVDKCLITDERKQLTIRGNLEWSEKQASGPIYPC